MKLRKWVAAAAAAIAVLGGSNASAAIVGTWSGLTFTVSENSATDGRSSAILPGFYVADFDLVYASPLVVSSYTVPNATWLPNPPNIVPGTPGNIYFQVVTDTAPSAPFDIFSVTFLAPGAQPNDPVTVTITNQSANGSGAYGDWDGSTNQAGGTSAGFANAETPGSVPTGSTVPEPSALALVGLALAGLMMSRRRNA